MGPWIQPVSDICVPDIMNSRPVFLAPVRYASKPEHFPEVLFDVAYSIFAAVSFEEKRIIRAVAFMGCQNIRFAALVK